MATQVHFHTLDELVDLLATVISGVAGGSKVRWREAIGPVTQLPTWCNIQCNWRITPRGSGDEMAAIKQVTATVRAEQLLFQSDWISRTNAFCLMQLNASTLVWRPLR